MCDIDLKSLSIEDTTARHKKERKELQAKIQALKKSAGKGDKKKKKEVLEEITKLELELDEKHTNELAQLDQATKSIDVEPHCKTDRQSDDDQSQRVSKAQKRRDKKAKQEKAKQAEIMEQAEINKTGPRATELKLIKSILKSRDLMLYPIPSDGDCLYNAIKHQLMVTGRTPVIDTQKLRMITAEYIQENKQVLIFYMSNPATGECLTDDEFTDYCESIKRAATWGGQIEIKAMSNALKVPIEVLQSSGPPTIQNDENFSGPPLVLTFHRFMYSLGEHYNSTMKYLDGDGTTSDEDGVADA